MHRLRTTGAGTAAAEQAEPAGSGGPVPGPGDEETETPTRTLRLALRQATTCLGGLGSLLHRRDPGTGRLSLTASDGLPPASVAVWADLGEERDVAPVRAVRDGAFAWVPGDGLGIGAGGTAAVPLLGPGGPVGVLSVLTAGPGEPDATQRSFLRTVAAWTGAHLVNAPGGPVGSERTVRMNELTVALAEAVTSQDVVRTVARYVVPPFGADGLLVDVIESGRVHVVDSTGYPDSFIRLLNGMPYAEHPVITDMLRTHTALFFESPEEFLRPYPFGRTLLEASPMKAWAFLPMVASGRNIGGLTLSFHRPRSFSDEDRTLLTTLSGLVGQALERARLYDAEHTRAQELQRGLLPRTLPRLPAVSAAARYLPAGRGEGVGGDWYDLIPLSADRAALVIGDVMGHGISEAATMGRLRTAVRTLADLDMAPDELLGHLNDVVSELGDDFYATCLYAVFDPVTRLCTFSLAGHPPPVVVHPDGSVHFPELAGDPPLGAADPPFETHELRLPEDCLLVLWTDGLVESAGRDFDEGLEELKQVLADAAARDPRFRPGRPEHGAPRLDDLCDLVTSALLPDRDRTTDDAALLIAHTHGTSAEDIAAFDLPYDPRAAGQARAHVRGQLAAWGLEDLVVSTELLVSELVGNAVRHARGPLGLRLLRSRSLICEVYDGSLTTPRIRRTTYTDEGGRGLQLVSALSRRWGARYLRDGKCIWTEQELERTPAEWGG
ncbi:SpoIIE family protein phosphatase [Streptomyces griseoruber]|uniref:SpoIIE family protein phosphatase n=1 Tax=Streptomyces griseoruber TaxID=1943 RepID=UPI00099E3820|nr:SpoIIE family protein phosphatase [Streptomyces griseoruber]